MAEYHKYVFDSENRIFIGNFEEMYKNETNLNYDSWHQDDSRHLNRKIILNIYEFYNFCRILDIGCGKGFLTSQLKKINNEIIGIDVSETAVNIARSRFPDIKFEKIDVNDIEGFKLFLDTYIVENFDKNMFELILISECLSYIENWRELIDIFVNRTTYLMISLFVPESPIGYVKSIESLEEAVEKNYVIIEKIRIYKSSFIILFLKAKDT